MDVEIKFEPDGRSGVVATGSYIFDAAKRLGVEIPECERRGESDLCAVEILSGKNLLSEPTKAELDTLGSDRFIKGERLACQAKIEGAGEIVIMAKKKKAAPEEEKQEQERKKVEEFRKEFDEMPLEKKIAALLELEAVTLGETLSFVINSPFKIFEKVMDVMAEFGLKLETEEKKAKRPVEHQTEEKNGSEPQAKTEAKEKSGEAEESVVESVPVGEEEKHETKSKKSAKDKESAEGERAEEQK